MGGKASKVLEETTLVACTNHGDGSKFPVICGTPTSEPIEGMKGGEWSASMVPYLCVLSGTRVHCVVSRRGSHYSNSYFSDVLDRKGCYKLGDKEVVQIKSHGMTKKHSTVIDSEGKIRAYVVTPKKGLTKGESYVLKTVPSYDGQEPVDPKLLAKWFGMEKDLKLYGFAKIESKKTGMSTGTAKYSIVDGAEDKFKLLYEAEKLGSMNLHCIVRSAEGDAVATASMAGMTFYFTVNAAEGVDLAAVLLTGQCTFSPDGATAGALAGAGVT